MKQLISAAILACAAIGSSASAQVSARIEIGQPGFYGVIDLGDTRPRLYAPRPVIIERHEHYIAEPVYLRVPPGHRRNWRKHCYRYGACGRPVLFVRDDWYQNTYAPRYRSSHGYAPVPRVVERRVIERRVVEHRYVDERRHGDHARGHGHGHHKGHGGHDEGHGRGHGKGHGHH